MTEDVLLLATLVLHPLDVAVERDHVAANIILLPLKDISLGICLSELHSVGMSLHGLKTILLDPTLVFYRSVSPQERRYEKERSYSRSPPRNGSRARSGSHEKAKKSYSGSRSPRRSVSPRRNRSYTPEQARSPVPRQSRSPSPRGERNVDRSPSQ